MSYDIKTPRALEYLGFDLSDTVMVLSGGAITIDTWPHIQPQPTEQDILDTLATQAFLDWEAENGGDPTLTARRIIREAIDDPAGKVLVALVKVMIDQGIIAATPAQVRNAIENKIAAGEVD